MTTLTLAVLVMFVAASAPGDSPWPSLLCLAVLVWLFPKVFGVLLFIAACLYLFHLFNNGRK